MKQNALTPLIYQALVDLSTRHDIRYISLSDLAAELSLRLHKQVQPIALSEPRPGSHRELDAQLRTYATYLQSKAREANLSGLVQFFAKVEGSVGTPGLKITYEAGIGYDSNTKGRDPQATIEEELRRQGWNKANTPELTP